MSALPQASGIAFAIVKYAGVGYLLYLAWTTWRDTGALSVEQNPAGTSVRSVIAAGITLNLLNPKLTLFFFAFLPQFVPTGSGAVAAMIGLSAVFMGMTFVIFTGYGVCASAVRDRVLSQPRVVDVMRKVFAGTFVALSARLAMQSR